MKTIYMDIKRPALELGIKAWGCVLLNSNDIVPIIPHLLVSNLDLSSLFYKEML